MTVGSADENSRVQSLLSVLAVQPSSISRVIALKWFVTMEGGCWTPVQSILRTAVPSVGLYLCSPAKVSVGSSLLVWALQEMVTL